MSDAFDVAAYLARIGLNDVHAPDTATLTRIHRAHLAAIPFENLDIQMGHAIELDPAALQADLVQRRRGGYCFQQNGLLLLALAALGYAPRPREARVRLDADGVLRPRMHMALVVALDGAEWLADVGFGGSGIVEPLALDGPAALQDGWMFRVVPEGRLHVLQHAGAGSWNDLYAFTDDEPAPVDYVVANWFTSTHPGSAFVRSLTAQRVVGGVRHVLRNLSYSVAEHGDWQTRTLARGELVPLLRDAFGLDVPVDARFRAIDGGDTDRA